MSRDRMHTFFLIVVFAGHAFALQAAHADIARLLPQRAGIPHALQAAAPEYQDPDAETMRNAHSIYDNSPERMAAISGEPFRAANLFGEAKQYVTTSNNLTDMARSREQMVNFITKAKDRGAGPAEIAMAESYVDEIDKRIASTKDRYNSFASDKNYGEGSKNMWKTELEAYELFYHRPWFGWGDSEADIMRRGRSSRLAIALGAIILTCMGAAFWVWYIFVHQRSKQPWAAMKRIYGDQFYLASSSQRQPGGPYSIPELQRMKQQGLLTPDSYLWHERMEAWISFRQIQNQSRIHKS